PGALMDNRNHMLGFSTGPPQHPHPPHHHQPQPPPPSAGSANQHGPHGAPFGSQAMFPGLTAAHPALSQAGGHHHGGGGAGFPGSQQSWEAQQAALQGGGSAAAAAAAAAFFPASGPADPESLFHNLCCFLEQALFTLVDWARNADYFKVVSVEDQMQLLNSSWGEILLLEYLYHCVHDNRKDSIESSWYSSQLNHSADILDLLDLSEVKLRLMDLIERVQSLRLDKCEFAALKFLLMFNAGKHDIMLKHNADFVSTVEFKISCSLLDYILENSPQQADKFGKILLRLPEIKYLAFKLECYLTDKLRTGKIPRNTLIAEMLLSKTKSFGGDQSGGGEGGSAP
uniref:NR LBD domain-containing protein n=1 Tax=Macrostomum lignano TaxID=282301 RepID=A0A1I8ILM2_9PLAT